MVAAMVWWWVVLLFGTFVICDDEAQELIKKIFSRADIETDTIDSVYGVCESIGDTDGEELCRFDSPPRPVPLSSHHRQGFLRLVLPPSAASPHLNTNHTNHEVLSMAGVLDHQVFWACPTLEIWHKTLPYGIGTYQRLVCPSCGCSKEVCASVDKDKPFPREFLGDMAYRLPGYSYCKWYEPNTKTSQTMCNATGACLFYRAVATPRNIQQPETAYFIWKCGGGGGDGWQESLRIKAFVGTDTDHYSTGDYLLDKGYTQHLGVQNSDGSSSSISFTFDGRANFVNGTPLPQPSTYFISSAELKLVEYDPTAGLPFLLCPPTPMILDHTEDVSILDCHLAAEPRWHCDETWRSNGGPSLSCYVDGGANANGQRGLDFDRFVEARISADGRRFHLAGQVVPGEPIPPGRLRLDSAGKYWSTSVRIGVHGMSVVARVESALDNSTRFLIQLGVALAVIYATKRIVQALINQRHSG